MRCSKCGADNRQGRKFCAKCGGTLVLLCPKCGASNEPGEDFCGECGTALITAAEQAQSKSNEPQIRIADRPTPENLEGERKTVTALFADIKGSMELMEDLDPEEARAIVDPALKLMMEAVHHYGGYVAQSTGDGIFALFGAPVAHEDHPQRALFAALRMQAEVKRYADKLRAQKGVNIQVRVGANTGEVVVREIRTGEKHAEYLPIGHSTSVAARLQGLATPGSIAISDALRKLVEGYFALKPLGPARIKGVSEPLEIFEVTGLGPLRTHFQISARRGLTRFVGREPEMAALDRAAELVKSGHGQIVAVVGEPGVGKSRLFFEFKARHQAGWKQLEAFSVSHGKAASFMPLNELLKKYFGIDESDETRIGREKIAGRIAMLDRSLEDTLPYLFALLGFNQGDDPLAGMDANIRRRRTLDAITRILIRESKTQPLIVVFEDLHWIDDETQALLNLLTEVIGDSPTLLALNYRPEYRHDWGTRASFTQIRLEPLKREFADEMLGAMLGDDPSVVPLRKLIIEKSGATPFFIEEMVQTLFEEGVLTGNGAVRATKPVTDIHLPATVNAVLASRIDRLSPQEKELLQTLAVIGDEFALELVREVVKIPSDALDSMLSRLQDGEFIYEQAVVDDIEYRFKHALTREVAYNSILTERRKLLHECVGGSIETLYHGSLEEHLGELARHYAHSGNAVKAVEYLIRSAWSDLARSSHVAAEEKIGVATAKLSELPDVIRAPRELDLRLLESQWAYVCKGLGAPEVEVAASQALAIANSLIDRQAISSAHFYLHNYFVAKNPPEYPPALQITSEEIESAQASGDTKALIVAHAWLAQALAMSADLAGACENFEKSISLHAQSGNHSFATLAKIAASGSLSSSASHAAAYAVYGLAICGAGYPGRGVEIGLQWLEAARSTKDSITIAAALVYLARTYHLCKRHDLSLSVANEAVSFAESQGLPFWVSAGLLLKGLLTVRKGELAKDANLIDEGLRIVLSQEQGAPPFHFYLMAVAEIALYRRDWEFGLKALEAPRAVQAIRGDGVYQLWLRLLKAELLAQRGRKSDTAEAEQLLRYCIEYYRPRGAKYFELLATIQLARLLRDSNRRDEARTVLGNIYNWFSEGFDTADLKDAKALLGELGE